MARKSEITLKNFFIFNPSLGSEEGEEEKKILFYHPQDTEKDNQIKDVGLCEAIIKFTSTFSPFEECKSFRTQKTCQVYFEPEPEFWMVLTINVPFLVKLKDGVEYTEYRGDDVHDSICGAVLEQAYSMFRLFVGTFKENFSGQSLDEQMGNLSQKLQQFFSKYILTMRIANSDIIDVTRTIQYLPLNQTLFLRVHNFISMIESTFDCVKRCIFLYNEQIVWSGINPRDLYCIYEYLSGTIFPKMLQSDLQGGSVSRNYALSQRGNFLTGGSGQDVTKPPRIFLYSSEETPQKSPKMYLHDSESGSNEKSGYFLVIYRAFGAIICLFVDDSTSLSEDLYGELQAFIGPQLTTISSEISENFSGPSSVKINDFTDGFSPKFLFFNEFSLQHDSTFFCEGKTVHKSANVSRDIMNVIADLYGERTGSNVSEETVVKMCNDFWITHKKSNARHFIAIINKNGTLLEIAEETSKMCDQHIKNVFFDKQI
ncbi:vacuolar fusion protein CCZ1 homolog [Phlebotomus argentipes]|uniref:vacuolar fusion protein CCZ1 homolog n=1 Tax=Phlebotomus argentipes TaxID=94469 RepID=UPI002892F049|nr:vacuolar fusion protein CCZ1 homolog [Phlebotomus argentipes]